MCFVYVDVNVKHKGHFYFQRTKRSVQTTQQNASQQSQRKAAAKTDLT
jgi:hypothetical protein